MQITMRATKGFLSALGASGALLGAAACALLIVSAIVAQQGWPGVASPLSSSQVVARTADSGKGPGGAAPVSGVVPTVRVNVGAAATAAGRPRTSPRVARAPRPGSTRTPHRALGGRAAGRPPATAATGSVPASTPTTPSAQSGSATLGQNVQAASGAAGNVVAPASPTAGNVVSQLGRTAGGATDETTSTVGAIVHRIP
jgi:hypothetical protein